MAFQILFEAMKGCGGQWSTQSPSLTSLCFTESAEGYRCERCGKVFTYKYYRDKHLKYTPCVDKGDRKFPCSFCQRSFEKRDRLRIHILHVHERHRPYLVSGWWLHVCLHFLFSASSILLNTWRGACETGWGIQCLLHHGTVGEADEPVSASVPRAEEETEVGVGSWLRDGAQPWRRD